MPELLKPLSPSPQQSHAQTLREEALRRLSRSPHPYHRQQFELPHASERLSAYTPPTRSPLLSRQNTDDDEREDTERSGLDRDGYRESTNSDSGTEADDEHFLKGLPAPRLKSHKGLRGVDGVFSGASTPLLSPAVLDVDTPRSRYLRKPGTQTIISKEDIVKKAADKLRHKGRVEIVRRVSETALLGFVTGILCLNPEVRQLIWLWKRELACQTVTIMSLVSIYPLRLLRHINSSKPWQRPLQIAIPTTFDPAPLLYPPLITMLVSFLLSTSNPAGLLPSIILAIASLPKQLIPSFGGLESLHYFQWIFSCLPLLIPKSTAINFLLDVSFEKNANFNYEILLLLQPLHLALCDTLHYLTTTSLLPAELQLLSISLIELLLLATSPQAVILKSVLWGCGIGTLVTCTHVLRWGVTLARVPKWRFRRPQSNHKPRKSVFFGQLPTSIFTKTIMHSDSSDDEVPEPWGPQFPEPPRLQLKTRGTISTTQEASENGSASAIEPKAQNGFANGRVKGEESFTIQRRHTLPTLVNVPTRSSKRTPSGRRKRSASSSVQSFFSLTQTQATVRKWLYAAWVYLCIVAIILVGVREYVGKFALHDNEPIGWALGYLFGDLPWFRMEVVKANLQRWICIPPRSGFENEESCHLGWVEHLRHATFGEANTRLILCAYWLAIIVVGLAIVFRLSAIYEVDTRRKVFHFMMVGMLLPATFVDPTFAALALALMLAIFLLLDLFRASQLPPLSKSLAYFLTPYVDGRDLKGPVVISHIFLLIGCAIPLWLSLGTLPRIGNNYLTGWEVPTREVSMVSGVICVGLGDAAASLIGRRYGRRKWVWGGGKSIEGSVAFATAVGIALLVAKAWLRIGGWQANNDDAWVMTVGKAGVAACVASLTEAVLTGGNDNVVVPVVLWLWVKGLDI
ncbi:cytidylyltransferase [Halenospora varia]|nr:cytidylyltransferase [Halenospora varia]